QPSSDDCSDQPNHNVQNDALPSVGAHKNARCPTNQAADQQPDYNVHAHFLMMILIVRGARLSGSGNSVCSTPHISRPAGIEVELRPDMVGWLGKGKIGRASCRE